MTPEIESLSTQDDLWERGGQDGAKLFIGQLPRSLDEADLRQLMEGYGEIVELTVLRCKMSQRGRGCGFCTFKTRESALAAIENLHETSVFPEMKNPLQVKFADTESSSSKDQREKLFVGQLPKDVDEELLSAGFGEYGVILECQVRFSADQMLLHSSFA